MTVYSGPTKSKIQRKCSNSFQETSIRATNCNLRTLISLDLTSAKFWKSTCHSCHGYHIFFQGDVGTRRTNDRSTFVPCLVLSRSHRCRCTPGIGVQRPEPPHGSRTAHPVPNKTFQKPPAAAAITTGRRGDAHNHTPASPPTFWKPLLLQVRSGQR